MGIQLFRYPGGKSKHLAKLRPYLDSVIGKSENYFEGFAGSGAVGLDIAQRFPDKTLIFNDYDSWISAFWQLTQESDDVIDKFLALLNTKPTIELFKDLRSKEPKDLLEKAYYAIFFNRCTFSGISFASPIGGWKQESKWTVDCRYNADKLTKDFLSLHRLLKDRLIVSNLHILNFLDKIDLDVPLYLDPPYYVKGSGLYKISMTFEEHFKLSEKLKNRTNWILSYDYCPEITEFYKEWTDLNTVNFRYSIKGTKLDWEQKLEYIITPQNQGSVLETKLF